MEKLSNKLYSPSQHQIYLSIFRIYLCFHLLKKVILQWSSLDTIYGINSFMVPYRDTAISILNVDFLRTHYKFIIFFYIALILLYALGIGRHWTALGVYFFLEILQRINGYILNGGDNYLKFLVLYMVFCDSYQYLTVQRLEIKNTLLQRVSNLFTNLGTLSIRLHLCLIYMVTGLHKVHSKLWFNGVATYYTLSLERFTGTSLNQYLAKNGLFVTISTYATMIWEVYVPVLLWVKKARLYVMAIGVCLHLGIYFFMMIHDFQILYIMVYGFFFSDTEWRNFLQKLARIEFVRKAAELCGILEQVPESSTQNN